MRRIFAVTGVGVLLLLAGLLSSIFLPSISGQSLVGWIGFAFGACLALYFAVGVLAHTGLFILRVWDSFTGQGWYGPEGRDGGLFTGWLGALSALGLWVLMPMGHALLGWVLMPPFSLYILKEEWGSRRTSND